MDIPVFLNRRTQVAERLEAETCPVSAAIFPPFDHGFFNGFSASNVPFNRLEAIQSPRCFGDERKGFTLPIGSMYGIYTNIGGILMVNVTIYGIHGSYGL